MPMLKERRSLTDVSQKVQKINQHEQPQRIISRQSPGESLRELPGLPTRSAAATRNRVLVGQPGRTETVPILPCL
jgi:hypothetical protein